MEIQISIVIATWNAAETLNTCLDSIVPQLTEETELIIIDGGSKDATNEIIASYGDKVAYTISEKDKGIYDAWNKGVKAVRGKWVAFIGADDVLLPNAINTYLNCIYTTNDIDTYDYICAHNEYVDMNGKLLKILGEEPKWAALRKMMPAAHVASLHNKHNLFEITGGYCLDFRICADYEMLMRKKGDLKYLMLDAHIARMKVGGMSFSTKAIKETYSIRKKHHSVSASMNAILFMRDWTAYKLFRLRKTLGRVNLANLLSAVKGDDYTIDYRIPSSFFFRLTCSKSISLLWGMLRLRTFKKVFVHPTATVKCAKLMHVGSGFAIDRDCYVNALSSDGFNCGKNVSMGFHTHIELTGSFRLLGQGMWVGDNVGFGSHGHYGSGAGKLIIGDNTIFGNYVSIHPENHNYSNPNKPIREQGVNSVGGVIIGNNCWIGAKATILDGTVIGNNCIVAAGAVVRGEFPDNVIIGGVPAKIIKHIYE